MKSVHDLTNELAKSMPLSTSLEKTRLLVFIDTLYQKPYRDHRLELTVYSVRYKANNNDIYVYNKKEELDSVNTEYLDDVKITGDYKSRVVIRKNIMSFDKTTGCMLLKLFIKLKILKKTAKRKLEEIELYQC